MKPSWADVLRTTGRILTFRANREEFDGFCGRHLAFGLLCTWVVGIGRSWDDPRAEVAQLFGLGSVLYVLALALLLSLLIRPFRTPRFSYFRILTFICLVSPPAMVYAIPVEMFLAPGVAAAVNLTFLVIVATWRVALLYWYVHVVEGLRTWPSTVLTLLPLCIIIVPLVFLGALVQTEVGYNQGQKGKARHVTERQH